MKKITLFMLSAVLLCGCSTSTASATAAPTATATAASAEPAIGMPNPMTEVANAAEFEDAALQTMITPANATDTKYYIYKDGPSEIQFTLDGVEYSYRGQTVSVV